MSNRKSDTRGEKALSLFLDRYYYTELCELEGFKGTKRIFDVKSQKEGADLVIYSSSGQAVIIDEKAQLYYINKPRQTFAFELSYYNDRTNGIQDGWFISDNNKTEYYVLIWIDSARTDQLNRIVEEDFNEISVALISKKKVLRYLSYQGYSIERLKSTAQDMRAGHKGNPVKISESAFIYYTEKGYDEKPINVVIDRTVLDELAYGVYTVKRTGVSKVN